MRITVEIDENKMKSILKWTRENKKSPAISLALDEFLELKHRQTFLSKVLSGKTDYAAGNDEIEAMSNLEKP
jgi:hypothetical protein